MGAVHIDGVKEAMKKLQGEKVVGGSQAEAGEGYRYRGRGESQRSCSSINKDKDARRHDV